MLRACYGSGTAPSTVHITPLKPHDSPLGALEEEMQARRPNQWALEKDEADPHCLFSNRCHAHLHKSA